MIRITAGAVVTFEVVQVHALRHRPLELLIQEPMDHDMPTAARDADSAIAIGIEITAPDPTAIGLLGIPKWLASTISI